MATAKRQERGTKDDRYSELKRMLDERQREVLNEVQGRIRDVRSENPSSKPLEAGENAESDIQEDIEFALIQMKAETLSKIQEALGRLEDGSYGDCFDCGEEISPHRLRALPFAVRCRECEERREVAVQRARTQAQRRGAASLFFVPPN